MCENIRGSLLLHKWRSMHIYMYTYIYIYICIHLYVCIEVWGERVLSVKCSASGPKKVIDPIAG